MKVVYIAGPYMGDTHDGRSFFQIHTNILFAREYAKKVFALGAFAFCPHLNSYHMELDLEADPNFFREADLEMVSRCDAVFLIPGWLNSKGVMLEKEFAESKGIPTFTDLETLSAWIHYPEVSCGN